MEGAQIALTRRLCGRLITCQLASRSSRSLATSSTRTAVVRNHDDHASAVVRRAYAASKALITDEASVPESSAEERSVTSAGTAIRSPELARNAMRTSATSGSAADVNAATSSVLSASSLTDPNDGAATTASNCSELHSRLIKGA